MALGNGLFAGFLHHLHKNFFGNVDLPSPSFEHLFLTAFLLLKQFHFARDVTAVEISGDVFAHS